MRESNRQFITRIRFTTPDTSGRLSTSDYDRWVRLWTWSAARFSGAAGALQERFYNARGWNALESRRDRVRRAIGACPDTGSMARSC